CVGPVSRPTSIAKQHRSGGHQLFSPLSQALQSPTTRIVFSSPDPADPIGCDEPIFGLSATFWAGRGASTCTTGNSDSRQYGIGSSTHALKASFAFNAASPRTSLLLRRLSSLIGG